MPLERVVLCLLKHVNGDIILSIESVDTQNITGVSKLWRKTSPKATAK